MVKLTEHQMALLSAASADHNFSPSDEQLSKLRAQTKLSLAQMKWFFRMARSRPRSKGARKGKPWSESL
jgi:hypothetical protein